MPEHFEARTILMEIAFFLEAKVWIEITTQELGPTITGGIIEWCRENVRAKNRGEE